jgi:hypothetical protein
MKCPHCGEELEVTWQPDTTGYLQGMGKLTTESKNNRIWQTAENLATSALLDIPSKSRSKEKLLELFKYFLRELMKSEGE